MEKQKKETRKLSLSAQGASIVFLLLNNEPKGNSTKEIHIIDSAMDDLEASMVVIDDKGNKKFQDVVLYITEAVYNLINTRFTQYGGWYGTARKTVIAFEDAMDNAEKVNGKPEITAEEALAPAVDANVPEPTEPEKT